ncbi:MAG: hypothetical protein GEU68_04815 [Actinobacteria bacterium]|nr:hypothetical protein [Actinomycetota bacterium]
MMMRALLLATKDDTSDRESARRSRVDLDWKAALGFDFDHPGIGATTFSLFRARVVLHDADQALFRDTVAKAVDRGLFPKKVLALIDSSPVLGAGAVKDTYELLRSAIQKVVRAAGEDSLPSTHQLSPFDAGFTLTSTEAGAPNVPRHPLSPSMQGFRS